MEEKEKQSFDDNWPLFERILGYLRYFKIKRFIRGEKKPVCADIGCGFNGRFLYSIRHAIRRGYGFDLRANPGQRENIRVVNNSAYGGALPLKDGRADRVFLLAVLEHLDMESKVIPESFRILKEGGRIILTTPTPVAKPVLEFLSFKLHMISEESILEHKHYYNKKELYGIMEKYGCRVVYYSLFQLGFNQVIVGEKM